jgi:hypothetical protein
MDLPVQAISLYLIPKYDCKRQESAKYTVNEMNCRLADGDFNVIYHSKIDEDSDESTKPLSLLQKQQGETLFHHCS